MNSKKAITLLVLATMILAMVPVMPASAAVAVTTSIYEKVGGAPGAPAVETTVKGDTLVVKGSGVSSGAKVGVYWRNVNLETFTGGEGKLNETTAKQDGTFEVFITTPEAITGDHYVWVKDLSTGQNYGGSAAETSLLGSSKVTVQRKISVAPTSALPGDTITISGYGWPSKVDISTLSDDFENAAGGALDATYSPSTPKSDSVGSFTATFKIPTGTERSVAAGTPASYTITAGDGTGTATNTLKVGAAITLDKTKGPSGTVVKISGRGFTAGATIVDPNVKYNGVTAKLAASVTVKSDGTFTASIAIPETALAKHDVAVTEDTSGVAGTPTARTATASYTIDGEAKIKMTPAYGPAGSTITVEGWNFTKISGTTVKVTLGGANEKSFTTDSNGYFSGTYQVPAVASGNQAVVANQADYTISATKDYRVGLMLVILSKTSGPTGAKVSITGTGFTTSTMPAGTLGRNWNATIGGKAWVSSTALAADGTLSATKYIPNLEPGTYDIVIEDMASRIQVTVQFTVTEKAYLESDPVVAPNGYNMTFVGRNFAADGVTGAAPSLEFVLYNASTTWPMDVKIGSGGGASAAVVTDHGNFTAWYVIPGAATLSTGAYTVNVTDGEGLKAQYTLNIVSKTVEISARKAAFNVGETVAFDVESSFALAGSYIKVYDPSGSLYWQTDGFTGWVKVGTVNVVPYYKQVAGGNPLVLTEAAPLGTWTWKWYDAAHKMLDNGSFVVEAATADQVGQQVEDLNQEITDLAEQLTGVTGDISSVKDEVSDVAAIAEQAVAAAQAAADAVNAVAQTANTASQAADNAADAAEAARDAASGLTTLVYGAIGAALVAALAAIVSLMQISRRIAG